MYAAYGKLLCEKTVEMIPVEKRFSSQLNVLAIGDSMTRGARYLEHIQSKLYKVNFKGTRSFNGLLYHEGRGGWTLGNYLSNTGDEPSPFLFPKGIDNYYGNMDFYNLSQKPKDNMYFYAGYHDYRAIKEGECYLSKGKLYASDGAIISDNPQWEFNFSKYMARYEIGKLDAVSLLFGANDLQITKYEETEEHIKRYINNLNIVINSIKAYDPGIKIIINMPIPGADQNAWGMRCCLGSSKRYNYHMMMLGNAILENFSNKENIFISPMGIAIDTKSAFGESVVTSTVYTTHTEVYQNNWVHPQRHGYRQMGDVLAAIIEKIRV